MGFTVGAGVAVGTIDTVTLHVALMLLLYAEVQVIVAVPVPTAFTVPPETVATEELLVDQVTFLLVALPGATDAVSVVLSPTFSDSEDFDREMPVTATVGCVTVTVHVALMLLLYAEVQVIVAVPAPTAFTVPPETVATEELLVDQVTFLLVALPGVIVAVSVELLPTFSDSEDFDRVMPVTETTSVKTIAE